MKRLALLLLLVLFVVTCQDERSLTEPNLKVQIPDCNVAGNPVTELICALYPEGKLLNAALKKWASIQDKMPDAQDEAQRKALELVDKTTQYWAEGELLDHPLDYSTAAAVAELTHLLFVFVEFDISEIPPLAPPPPASEEEDFGIGIIDPDGAVVISANGWVAVDAPAGATEDLVIVTMELLGDPTCDLGGGSLEQTVGCWEINFSGQPEFGEVVTVEACVAEPEGGMSDDEWDLVLLHKYTEADGVVTLPWAEPQHVDCSDFMGYEPPIPAGARGLEGPLLATIGTRPPKGLGGTTGSGSEFFGAVPEGAVPNIVSWWPGNDHYYDLYGLNHLTVVGSVPFVPGIFEEAFGFTGGPDVLNKTDGTPNIDDLQTLTLHAWVKLDEAGPGDEIQRFVTLLGEKAVIRQDGDNAWRQLHFYMNFGTPEALDLRHVRVDDALRPGCFHHVVGTYDGSVMRAYLDGVEVGSEAVVGTVGAGNGIEFSSEATAPPYPEALHGTLDEVMVLDRALDPAEIQHIYDAADVAEKCGPFIPPEYQLSFVSDRDGNLEIYTMEGDGSGQINRTNDPAVDIHPSWSPNGQYVAFSTNRDGNREIYVMNADGTGLTRITDDPALDSRPVWSPDGSKIAFHTDRDGDWEIFVMNADGSDLTNLTDDPGDDLFPTWSPDGNHIAFSSERDGNREIYVMDADDGSGQTNLTNDPASDHLAAWSPDGTKIAFTSTRDGDSGNGEIYVMDSDGSNPTRLTHSLGAGDHGAAWSPDGEYIAFATHRDGDWEIYAMNADGTQQTNISNNPGSMDDYPAFRPTPAPAVFGGTLNSTSLDFGDYLVVIPSPSLPWDGDEYVTIGGVQSTLVWTTGNLDSITLVVPRLPIGPAKLHVHNQGPGQITQYADVHIMSTFTPNSDPLAGPDISDGPFPMLFYIELDDVESEHWLTLAPSSNLTVTVHLTWQTVADLDILWTNEDATGWAGNFDGATASNPEESTVTIPGGTTYRLWLDLWDSGGASPTLAQVWITSP